MTKEQIALVRKSFDRPPRLGSGLVDCTSDELPGVVNKGCALPDPPVARRNGEQGRVILRVLVNPNGTADDVQVRTSSGFTRLDDSARDTVRRWKFVPAKRGAEPVPAWVLIPISFRLEG